MISKNSLLEYSKTRSLFVLHLRVERSYKLERFTIEYMNCKPEYLEKHELALWEFLEYMYEKDKCGVPFNTEFRLMTLEFYPIKDHTIHYVYELVVVLRSSVGDLKHITFPSTPSKIEMLYEMETSDMFRMYEPAKLDDFSYHDASWSVMEMDEFLSWYSRSRPMLFGSFYYVPAGGYFSILDRLNCDLNSVNRVRSDLDWEVPIEAINLYCSELEWNEYRVLAIWRIYLFLYKDRVNGDYSILWERYGEVLSQVQSYSRWDLSEYPNLYDISWPYVDKARMLVLSNTRYLNLMLTLR